jgi:hypothetical protein
MGPGLAGGQPSKANAKSKKAPVSRGFFVFKGLKDQTE